MTSLTRVLRVRREFLLPVACGFLLHGDSRCIHGQISNTPPPLATPQDGYGRARNDEAWPNQKELEDRLQRTREKERQRRIVDDANRLVQLTVLYRKSLGEHGAPTLEDQKLLAQIEKLAREVKDRMRGM